MARKQMRIPITAATFKGVLYELNMAGIPWSLVSVVNSDSDFELVVNGEPTGFVIHLGGDNNWRASALIDLPVEA